MVKKYKNKVISVSKYVQHTTFTKYYKKINNLFIRSVFTIDLLNICFSRPN